MIYMTLILSFALLTQQQTCPDGQFFDSATSSCLNCSSSCLTCTNSANSCTSCKQSFQYVDSNTLTCVTCPGGQYYNQTSSSCQACPNSPGYCLNSTTPLTCTNPYLPILNLDTLKCVAACPMTDFIQVTFPNHEWNNNQDLTVCRKIFNFYDAFPRENLKIMVSGNTLTRAAWGFKENPLVLVDKNITIDTYNQTASFYSMLNATDKKVSNSTPASILYSIMPQANQYYNFAQKLSLGKITDVQNSQIKDYPVTLIRSSITFNRVNLRVDLTTVDVNQKFLNMDESDYQTLQISNSQLQIQGIFGDIKNSITAIVANNTFNLAQTNFLLTVRPGCRSDIDFTKNYFLIRDNNFSSTPTVFISYHLFFYKGFSNATYHNNFFNNIVEKGYSHLGGQYVECPDLMANNTIINFVVTRNFWNMTTGQDDGRVEIQIQETNPNIKFSVMISNNTWVKLFSKFNFVKLLGKIFWVLLQNYNLNSYIEFNGNNFIDCRVEHITVTFYTETDIYLFNNYVTGLYNRVRHFLYLDGPKMAHFKNLTLINAYSKNFHLKLLIAGIDYNAYAFILADIADGTGILIFEGCNFTNWDVNMHYGINIAVKVQSLIFNNTVFQNIKLLPLWHTINIKETQQLVMNNVLFKNFSFQAPKSSNGFAINVINLDINSNYPNSIIKNITVEQMSTNFFQLINAHSEFNNQTAYLNFTDLKIVNNTFDAEISLFQFNGFLLTNSFLEVEISNSTFMNNTFQLYGNIIALKQNMIKPITIRNTLFQNNYGAMFDLSSGNIALVDYPTQLKVDSCSFIRNIPYSKALLVVNENCISFIYNSFFLENYSVSRGSIIMADYQDTKNYFENCTFQNNSASVGGVFYTQFGSMIDCYNCTVTNNFGIKGGVVYTSNDGYIRFRSSRIRWNKSLYSSILVTLSSPTSYTEFTDTLISRNQLLKLDDFIDSSTNTIHNPTGFLTYLAPDFLSFLQANTISIQNSVQLGLIYALNSISSNLKFQNLNIDNQENILSSFEATIIGSNLTIQNTQISETQNLLELTSTTFNIQGFTLQNITCNLSTVAKDKYLISGLLRSTFTISDLIMRNTTNPLIFMLSSTLNVINSSIQNLSISSSLYQPISLTDSVGTLNNVSVQNILTQSDSMIRASFSTMNGIKLQMTKINQTFILASDSTVNLTDSWLLRDKALDPPDLDTVDLSNIEYIRSCLIAEVTKVYITSSNISSFFSTDNGGAISTTNCNPVNISGSYFQDNKAMMGGAVYLYCDEDQTCVYDIKNTTFVSNVGVTRGGGIHYNYYAPIMNLSTITFRDNKAPYGQNISAYPFKLAVMNADKIRQQVSGQIIANPIEVQVQDFYGNIINIDNTTKIELQSVNITTTQIQGASTLTVNQGKATFDEVTLVSDPGRESEQLRIVLQQYDANQQKTAYYLPSTDGLNNLTINIDFRQCIVGEALQKQKCIKCPNGKFSLELNTTSCMNCPLNAQCPGGDVINVEQGYWRAKYSSSLIHECLYSPACLGGTSWVDGENVTWPTACDNGYGGNLCHACKRYGGVMYTRINKHECLQCSPNQTLNILRLVGIGLCLVIALAILIYLNLRKSGASYLAVLMRMMTNYMQILSFAASFNLGWPESLKRLYDSVSILSQSADMAFSVDCFFDNAGLSGITQEYPTFFIKATMLLVLPVFALILILIFWGLFGLIRKYDRAQLTRNTVVSIIVVIFLAHPTLTSTAFSMMNCYEIEPDELWLQADLEIMCWNGIHKKYFFFVGLPMLIIWVIGTPVTSFFLLLKNRKHLNDDKFFGKYRMLYQGLRRKHFYWEIVNTFRKISIVSINVFLALYPDYIKAIYAMLILAIIFKAQEVLQPYEIPVFNWIEQREQIASIVTFYAGLYFVKADVSEAFKYIIIVIVFFVNAWFLTLWSYVALLTYKYKWTDKLASWVKKIICRRINDEDLKPVEGDGQGVSNVSNSTRQASQAQKAPIDEKDFDLIKDQQTPAVDHDKSEILDQSENPLQAGSNREMETKRETRRLKKKKDSESLGPKSGSTVSKEKGSIIKGSNSDNKKLQSSSFSDFSEKILQDQNTKKIKEINEHETDEEEQEPPKKETTQKPSKVKEVESENDSGSSTEQQKQSKKKYSKKSQEVKSKKQKKNILQPPDDSVSQSMINENERDVFVDSIDADNETNQKLPYTQSTVNKKSSKPKEKPVQIEQGKEKERDKKTQKIMEKKTKEFMKDFDDSTSSFVLDGERVYTVKKKKKKDKRPNTQQQPRRNMNENILSASEDSLSNPPKIHKLN